MDQKEDVKNATIKRSPTTHVGHRLALRKVLFLRRRRAADLSTFCAVFGFLLIALEEELHMDQTFGDLGKNHPVSFILKSIAVLFTILLEGLVVYYHKINLRIAMVNDGIDDMRLLLTKPFLIKVIFEMILCAIQPLPGKITYFWKSDESGESCQVPLDTLLTPLMTVRLYWVARSFMLHSYLYQSTSSQSIGALNKIDFDFSFVLKSMMRMHPERVLGVMIALSLLWTCWAMRVCETNHVHSELSGNIGNNMWLITITFLTVGFGDVTPESSCGRMVAVITGVLGVGITALVVAVLAQRLELSRSEKFVQNFVVDSQIEKQIKHCSADIVKTAFRIFKHRSNPTNAHKFRKQLLCHIRAMKALKDKRHRLKDANITLAEIYRHQKDTEFLLQQLLDKVADIQVKVNH